MKTLPKSITILGKKYKVIFREKLHTPEGEMCAGYYDSRDSTIAVDKSLKGEDLVNTWLHECCHAVLDRVGLNVLIDLGMEELIVDNIATAFSEAFDIKIKKSR